MRFIGEHDPQTTTMFCCDPPRRSYCRPKAFF
jgi:hypothetical protein